MNEDFSNIKPKPIDSSMGNILHKRKFFEMEKIKLPAKPGIAWGIEETTDVVEFGIALANSVIKALEDGRITLLDIPGFIVPLTKLPAALSGIEFVPYELNDLQQDEIDKLKKTVTDNLQVDDERAKLIIEQSIVTLYQIYNLVKLVKGPGIPIEP